jgi:hypothetical protein
VRDLEKSEQEVDDALDFWNGKAVCIRIVKGRMELIFYLLF